MRAEAAPRRKPTEALSNPLPHPTSNHARPTHPDIHPPTPDQNNPKTPSVCLEP